MIVIKNMSLLIHYFHNYTKCNFLLFYNYYRYFVNFENYCEWVVIALGKCPLEYFITVFLIQYRKSQILQ